MPLVPALGRQRQKDQFKTCLEDLVFKKEKENKKEGKNKKEIFQKVDKKDFLPESGRGQTSKLLFTNSSSPGVYSGLFQSASQMGKKGQELGEQQLRSWAGSYPP